MYFVSVSNAFAQTDSLADKSYDELTKLYVKSINTQPSHALVYITKAHEVALKEKNKKNIAKTMYGIAFSNYTLANNSQALESVEKSILLFESADKRNNTLLFQAHNLKGALLTDLRQNSSALNAHLKAKAYAKKANNIRNEILASTNIAFIKKDHKDFKDAIRIFKENLETLENATKPIAKKLSYQLFQYANISEAYLRMGEMTSENYLKEAKYYNELGLQKCPKDDITSYSYLLINKIVILHEEGKYEESIALVKKTELLAIDTKDENLLCAVYFYAGKSYAKLNKYETALDFLEKANAIILTSEKKYHIERLLKKELSIVYTAIGNIEKGQEYFEKYVSLVEKETEEDIKVIKEVYIKNDIAELREELNKLSERMASETLQKQQLYVVLGILIVLLIISIFWYRNKVKQVKKRIENALQKANELEKTGIPQVANSSSISEKVTDAKAALLLQKLQKFEEEKMYLLPDCSLSFVAEQLDSNTSYVSNVINNYKNKTFKTYISELRINTALVQLKNDEKLRSYTIKAIAEEFGFKRQETFSKAFKTQTGIHPSQYLKKLRKDLETI
ncbi:helix-turn-helix domain-containing protein [Kordia jejudonensis]|uniref:helix-turn-helix domain-containing protein n=1 Tax=Kordia jejudonensis TaxID=1348245 RepID=UPI00138DFDF5|nr:helix-turn-helix domain-containing protein [Kordia jejudonensis]